MSAIAIIPARGGSKRIPRKNIKQFLGKPVIAYPIEVALKSGLFTEVMVSTDDDQIAEIARDHGAMVPFLRSGENSSDTATTVDVIKEVLYSYEEKLGKSFELACCIYPCTPLLKKEHLLRSFSILEDDGVACSYPIVAFSYPIWRSVRINRKGFLEMNCREYANSRSQDLPLAYHDAGMFYSFKVSSFVKNNNLLFNSKPIILNELEVQDIDTETDWVLAELKFRAGNAKV